MEKLTSSRASRMMRFIKGVFRFRSPGLKGLTQDSSDEEKLKQFSEKISLSRLNFVEKVSTFGLLPVLKSYVLRIRYTCALWFMREGAIILYLSENYEKIPPRTLSKIFARPRFSSLLVRLSGRIAAILFPLGNTSINSVKVMTVNK